MAKIMIQGTGSSVGKSILVTALCRIFKQDGYKVCPYKSQNMSLNSYITLDGKEMGRAQVLQAYASGLEPQVFMNPILLKPTSDKKCQVIVNGKVETQTDAKGYHNLKTTYKEMLKKDFEKLEATYDIIVMEGAGSPAEINLKDNDIVNMGMAELVNAPVLIVGDIDKGGVFASLAGTMLLLDESEKERVKGVIINKFRGDIQLLMPGIDMLDDIINRPTLGVVPHFNLDLEDEDGYMFKMNKDITAPIDIAVLHLPHISNFTDVDALKGEEDVSVRYITKTDEFLKPDLLILPGSKNVIDDLVYINESGFDSLILDYIKTGRLLGICGGYQMMGEKVEDPYHVESDLETINGLGIIPSSTILEKEKRMTRVEGKTNDGKDIYGYEIHVGVTKNNGKVESLLTINKENEKSVHIEEGYISENKRIFGTYIHGILDSPCFRQQLLNEIRIEKGLEQKNSPNYETKREEALNKLADLVRTHLDIDAIYHIMGMKL